MRATEKKEREAGEESLVPMIEEEERRLEALIEGAHRQAEEVVEGAAREAEQHTRSVLERLPELQEERRTRARAAFEKEADELQAEASAALTALRAVVEENRNSAIEAVIAAVWPLSR